MEKEEKLTEAERIFYFGTDEEWREWCRKNPTAKRPLSTEAELDELFPKN